MKISGLVVLHNTEGSADKVWGYFKDENKQYYKYWGKRLGNRFQTQSVRLGVILEDEPKKTKKGYIKSSLGVVTAVRDKLASQFGATDTSTRKEKSTVTGQEMEAPIRPSEVARTEERIDYDEETSTDDEKLEWKIFFYDKSSNLLGKRPLDQKETIFDHIKKTKKAGEKMTNSEGSFTYIDWKEKEPATA